MKILMLNYEFPPLGGGASPVSYEVAKRLSKNNQIDVVTMGYKNLPSREHVNRNMCVYRVKCLRNKIESSNPIEQATYLISAYFKTQNLLKKNKYDICHCHFIIPTGVLAFILKIKHKIPYIISVHGSDVPGYNPDRFTTLHKFTKPFLRIICDHSSKVVALSNYLKTLIKKNIKNYNKHKLIVIPNGIDTKKFKPTKKKRYILSTGRLLPRKGFQHLIKAISDKNIGYEVHIAGDGPMMANLKKLAKKSKTKIIFHGWVDNKIKKYSKLLSEADIFSLVSEKENSSISMLEAMSSGCAIITANSSGLSEMIKDAGIQIEVNKPKLLKKKLLNLIKNKKRLKNYQESARKRVLEYYDWDLIVKEYHKLLQKAHGSDK